MSFDDIQARLELIKRSSHHFSPGNSASKGEKMLIPRLDREEFIHKLFMQEVAVV